MTIVTFHPTRFGNWIVKLSYCQEYDTFLMVAHNPINDNTMVKAFTTEVEVISFVSLLGEKV